MVYGLNVIKKRHKELVMKTKSLLALGMTSLLLVGCASGTTQHHAQVDMAIERAEKRAAATSDDTQKVAVYERVYKQNPKSEKAAVEYARILRKSGRIGQAEAILSPFAEDVNSGADTFAEYAAIKVAKGENSEAEIFARDALKKQEDNSFAAHTLGIALDGLGRYKEAEESFRTALNSWKGSPVPVMNNLALNLATQGYIDESITLLERAKTLDPSRTELERNLRIIRALNEGSAAYFPDSNVPTPTKKPSR